MANYWGELTNYTASLMSGSGKVGASIVCSAGSTGAVYLSFYRSGPLPANTTHIISSGTRQFYLYFAYSELREVVDLLRTEKPVFFFFRDDYLVGYLTTSNEPVGEQEGV